MRSEPIEQKGHKEKYFVAFASLWDIFLTVYPP